LILSPRRLRAITNALADIPHVKVVRWHTRVPVVDPDRTTADLVAALKADGKATFLVLHTNHPRELTPEARAACARFVDAGIPMLSQSVLLRGVNDDPETLEKLLRALVETRIKPYYLHHGDLAPGTAHLRTGIEEGQALLRALRGRVSGLCQPAYMLDIPGGHGKAPDRVRVTWRQPRRRPCRRGFPRQTPSLSTVLGGRADPGLVAARSRCVNRDASSEGDEVAMRNLAVKVTLKP
jgi:lysine 2,3-aminomutase